MCIKCKDHNNLKIKHTWCFLVLTDQFVFSGLWLAIAEVAFETNWKAHLNHCELQKHLARYYLFAGAQPFAEKGSNYSIKVLKCTFYFATHCRIVNRNTYSGRLVRALSGSSTTPGPAVSTGHQIRNDSSYQGVFSVIAGHEHLINFSTSICINFFSQTRVRGRRTARHYRIV
jgi:hypothetical protein